MKYLVCFIVLLIPLVFSLPRSESNDKSDDRDLYLKQQLIDDADDIDDENSNENRLVRRHRIFSLLPVQHYQSNFQPGCLPHIWTCGPGLPPCCPGLMCFEGNAKRGRYCAARG